MLCAPYPHPVPDVSDFLGFLSEHEGKVVKVEAGVRAEDLGHADRPGAKLCGVLGAERLRVVVVPRERERGSRADARCHAKAEAGMRIRTRTVS